jgi:hypothetical protein
VPGKRANRRGEVLLYISGNPTYQALRWLIGAARNFLSVHPRAHVRIQKLEVEFAMTYWVDVIGFVLASDLFAASITGKFVSVGRGGGKSSTPIRSFRLRLALFLAAFCLVGVGVWHLRSVLAK